MSHADQTLFQKTWDFSPIFLLLVRILHVLLFFIFTHHTLFNVQCSLFVRSFNVNQLVPQSLRLKPICKKALQRNNPINDNNDNKTNVFNREITFEINELIAFAAI